VTPGTCTMGTAGGIFGRAVSPRFRTFIVLVAFSALVAATVWLPLRIVQLRDESARNAAVLAVARQQVADLFTVSSADAGGSIGRIARLATGEFRRQLTAQGDAYSRAIREDSINSTVKVNEAGVRQVGGNTASVLVSVVATVRSKSVAEPVERRHNLIVDEVAGPDGWLVSRVGFLP
jgi:Mce-associated membrane protein